MDPIVIYRALRWIYFLDPPKGLVSSPFKGGFLAARRAKAPHLLRKDPHEQAGVADPRTSVESPNVNWGFLKGSSRAPLKGDVELM